MNVNDVVAYAVRRLIFVIIAWGVVTYVVPQLMR
jgi:hypothetical protein